MTEASQDAHAVEGAAIRVFLNYRRDDTGAHALHLYADLVERFGDEIIFMDMRALEPGLDFEAAIHAALETCDVVLSLIGTRWVSAVNDDGLRRLDDPDDWVRLELEAALARPAVRVIPVLVERAEMPRRHELPEGLVRLANRQAFDLSNVHWSEGIAKLVAVLEGVARRNAEQLTKQRVEQERLAGEEVQRLAREQAEHERLAREQAERGVSALTVPLSPEERQELIDGWVDELVELIVLDERGGQTQGSLTYVWSREDGTCAMITVSPTKPGRRASVSPGETLTGLATGGRAAIVFDWGVPDEDVERGRTPDEEYEVIALVGPFPDEHGQWEKLAAFRLLVSRRDELSVEFVGLDNDRQDELIDSSLHALRALTTIGPSHPDH